MEKRIVSKMNSLEEFEQFVRKNKYVIVKAGAGWCKPCKLLADFMEHILKLMPNNIAIANVDIDKTPSIKRKLRIQSVPFLCNYINGQPMDITVGYKEESIIKFLEKTVQRTNNTNIRLQRQ